jgi:hypothetical protein
METVQSERTLEVLKIAEADLRRRLEQSRPLVDAQIQETLKICERELARREGEKLYWDSEFNFWHKIVAEEVARLRFNQGFEPVSINLYPCPTGSGAPLDFIGKTQIGRAHFNATGRWARDSAGKKVLRVELLKAP